MVRVLTHKGFIIAKTTAAGSIKDGTMGIVILYIITDT